MFRIPLLLLFIIACPAYAGEGEPLSVTVVAESHWGSNTFTRGAPLDISIFISNNLVRRSRQHAAADERAERQQAEKSGIRALPGQPSVQDSTDTVIRIADNGSGFFSKINLSLTKVDFLSGDDILPVDWQEMVIVTSFSPGDPVIVGEYPVWITLEFSPEKSSGLLPGSYLLSVSYPGAESGSLAFRVTDAANEAEQAMLDYELAEYFLRQQDYHKAVDHARKALNRLTVEHDMLYLTLGDAYMGLNKSVKAIESYEKFLTTYENYRGWEYPSVVRQTVNALKQEINTGKEK
jgi:tetratricopeptide (TPR) repeat protein